MKLVLATRNDHKVSEIAALLAGSPFEVIGLGAFSDLPAELPETGDTFVHNALEKARFVYERTGLVSIADDSGLEVDALGGRPGVFSKRFSAEATDAANNAKLLDLLMGREDRAARYRCVIAVVGPRGEATADGACEGADPIERLNAASGENCDCFGHPDRHQRGGAPDRSAPDSGRAGWARRHRDRRRGGPARGLPHRPDAAGRGARAGARSDSHTTGGDRGGISQCRTRDGNSRTVSLRCGGNRQQTRIR